MSVAKNPPFSKDHLKEYTDPQRIYRFYVHEEGVAVRKEYEIVENEQKTIVDKYKSIIDAAARTLLVPDAKAEFEKDKRGYFNPSSLNEQILVSEENVKKILTLFPTSNTILFHDDDIEKSKVYKDAEFKLGELAKRGKQVNKTDELTNMADNLRKFTIMLNGQLENVQKRTKKINERLKKVQSRETPEAIETFRKTAWEKAEKTARIQTQEKAEKAEITARAAKTSSFCTVS
jgi:hypothetical protein